MNQRPAPGELVLDHLAHFVPDLGAAGALWEKLGFKVTPVSHHQVGGKPAGTSNRCVMLGAGYIEILAPTLDTPNARRVRARMDVFVGIHLACFGTQGAEAEHARLEAHGFAPEPVVRLERPIDTGDLARFGVVHVPPDRMPEGRVQYCEHLTPEHVWRKGFVNRDFGLSAVYVVADDPAGAAARWGRFAGLLPHRDGKFVALRCARGEVRIGSAKSIRALLGHAPAAPALAGYALWCRNVGEFAGRCRKAGLKVKGRTVQLPASLGGAWLLESSAKEE